MDFVVSILRSCNTRIVNDEKYKNRIASDRSYTVRSLTTNDREKTMVMRNMLRLRVVSVLVIQGFLLIMTHGVSADVYRYVDENGVLHLTDRQPDPSAKPIKPSSSSLSKNYHSSQEMKVKFNSYIERVCRDQNFDSHLVKAVVEVESAYNHRAVSPKGARGLMQIMPDTGIRFGSTDLFDPLENIECGIRYLKYLSTLFEGELKLVLAAYNCGENRVLKVGDIPQITETVQYVQKVLNAYNRNKQRDPSSRIVKIIDKKGTVTITNRQPGTNSR